MGKVKNNIRIWDPNFFFGNCDIIESTIYTYKFKQIHFFVQMKVNFQSWNREAVNPPPPSLNFIIPFKLCWPTVIVFSIEN